MKYQKRNLSGNLLCVTGRLTVTIMVMSLLLSAAGCSRAETDSSMNNQETEAASLEQHAFI